MKKKTFFMSIAAFCMSCVCSVGNEQGHLPEIPSAAEVAESGINLSEMNVKLLQKVEELTLYIIAQNKDIQHLQKEVESIQQQR